jgi:DNA repair exonuclease SbcCD ATPase subunit
MSRKLFPLLFSLALLLVISGCAGAPAPGAGLPSGPAAGLTPTPDQWDQAVTDAQTVLQDADLEAHFQYYQDTAAQIDQYLAQLEKARPALDFIDTLKNTNIPVLGNAWKLLVRALDKAYLGAGVALEQLDERLSDLLETHERLQQLDQLQKTSDAVEQFQNAPSKETLQAMGKAMTEADFVLTGVDKDAASLQSKVDGLLDAVEKTQSGLNLLGGIVPQLSDAVKEIQQFVDDILGPLRELSQTLDTMRKQIAADRDIFWRIRDIIRKAETPPQSLLWIDQPLPI